MLLWRVTALLLVAGLKNRLLAQARRVRQPRYLLATAIGLLYWWWYFGRALVAASSAGPSRGLPEAWRPAAELGLAGLALLPLALGWLFGSSRAPLAFSEAEIQFLFPAPLTRRQLVHYKLLRLLASGLLGAAVTALFLGRSLGGPPVLFALGSWVALTTLSFHQLAASFARAGLARHGLTGARRFALSLAVVAALGAGLWLAARELRPPTLTGRPQDDLLAWAGAIDGSTLGWALWPLRAPVRLAMARSGLEFLLALPAALAVLALHYAWVLSAVVGFEDDAVHEAERRARLVESVRAKGPGGIIRIGGRRRVPFRLAPRGRPEVALLWKGLIASGRAANLRLLAVLAASVAAVAVGLGLSRLPRLTGGGTQDVVGLAAVLAWAYLVLFGSGLTRQDLRTDLANLEVLRTWPVPGDRLLRGQLAAPLAILTGAQWLVLPVAAVTLPGGLSPGWRAALALGAAVLGPAFTLAGLVLHNGLVILLPAWMPIGPERPHGPEALGLRLITALGHLLALGLALLLPGAFGALALLGAWTVLGVAGVPVAAAVAAATLAGEAWAATALLGRAFDRLDPSGL